MNDRHAMNIEFIKSFRTYAPAFFLLLCASITFPAAAQTDLSDVPMSVKNAAKPNIIFVTDDSGSMGSEVIMPANDGALWWHTGIQSFVGHETAGAINFNSVGDANGTWKKYVYLFPNGAGQFTGDRRYTDGANDHFAIPPIPLYAWTRSSAYNPLYYDPAKTYTPWAPYFNGTTTVTLPNAVPTAAKSHPLLGTGVLNLTADINVGTANWTFRMWPGMVPPVGSLVGGVPASPPPAGGSDVQISYFPATYYVVDPTAIGSPYVGPDGALLRRYEIKDDRTIFPSGRTYAKEIQNFANWFTYYRKRLLTLNAAMGSALDGVDGIRVGMFTFNSRSDVTMYNLSDATDSLNERAVLRAFYNLSPTEGTPTRESLDYVGQQFMRTDSNAPITHSCQFNIGFVLTDGFANASNVAVTPSNYDGETNYTSYPYNRQYSSSGATVTHPYQDSFSGTLADIAMKYYSTNLRPLLATGEVPVNTEETGPGADKNPNLHMNTYALGLGVKGTIFGTGSAAALNPYTTAPVWPNPSANRSPTSVDDLWHATLNGRGNMYTASDPTAVKVGLQTVISEVVAKPGSAAAVTVSNPNIVRGGVNVSYNSSYNSGNWTGDLSAYPIDRTNGSIDTSSPIWTAGSAGTQLDLLTAGAYAPTTRKIVTYSGVGQSSATGSGGLQFHSSTAPASASITSQLTATQEAIFNSTTTPPGPSDAAAVINYLRGDRSGESASYRLRSHVLGDIINAEAVLVQAPTLNYTDDCYATPIVTPTSICATSFKAAQRTRVSTLFQAANDGMVHAFDAGTGAEKWAYVPKLTWPNMMGRSKRAGFEHKYLVDATPTVGDVDFKKTDGIAITNPDWHTLLVGGLGKGGRGYYALDVTNPQATSEIDAASKVLWEFPNSTTSATDADNMGYSFGRPIIVKTAADGWVVLVPSGYNNTTGTGTGRAYLYVLNPRNGAVIKRIDTDTSGTVAASAGLAKISAYVENANLNNTVKYVYGGDLLGNVWRFNLQGTRTSWAAEKLAALVDSSGNAQPVTTEPELATVTIANTDYQFVYVGTGKYLGDVDVTAAAATRTQTMYGLIDDGSASPQITITATRRDLQQQTMSAGASASTRNVSNNAAVYSGGSRKKGWYLDLSLSPGERIVTDSQLAVGVLAFTTNIPSAAACIPGGSSWFYTINYEDGGIVTDSTFPHSGTSLGNALASRVTLIKLEDGSIKGVIKKSDTTIEVEPLPPPSGLTSGRRVSWREVLTN